MRKDIPWQTFEDSKFICSFCGIHERDTFVLIRGMGNAMICERCIVDSTQILIDAKKERSEQMWTALKRINP